MSDIGPLDGRQEEKTITVYCASESHQLWERTYLRRGDDFWTPNTWDRFDGESGTVKMPRRGGGMEFIDATGRVIRSWDGDLDPQRSRLMADI